MLTVYLRRTKGNGYTTTTKVEVAGDGRVHMATWSIGPRGGASYGMGPGFSANEWSELVSAVERKRCYQHPHCTGVRLFPGGDDLNGYGCHECFMETCKPIGEGSR